MLASMLDRARLGRVAKRFAEQDWPVVPGAYLTSNAGRHARERRFDCGELGCRTVACHPARSGWETAAPLSVSDVAQWWRTHPYTVLLATGHAFDVLEVPATLGRAALLGDGYVAARGPVAVAPGGRWMWFVRPGHGLLPELAQQRDVVLHELGSWVPAPPSPQFGGRVRWELAPEQHGWRPAQPNAVQRLMLDALNARRAAAVRDIVWRPVTWAT